MLGRTSSSLGLGMTTRRSTPSSANAAAVSAVSRPRGVTVISSGPSSAARSTWPAAARSPSSDPAAASGVMPNPYHP